MRLGGLVSIALILIGAVGLIFVVGGEMRKSTPASANAPTSQPAQSTPRPDTTPTPDAASIARVTLAVGDVTMQAIELESARMSIQMTAQAADLSNSITATAAALDIDNRLAAATHTARYAITTAARTAQADGATATAISIRIGEMSAESEARTAAIPWLAAWDVVRPVLGWILAVGVGLIIVARLGTWVFDRLPAPVVELGDLPDDGTYPEEPKPAPDMVIVRNNGKNQTLLEGCPLNAEDMEFFAEGIVSGRKVTYREWCNPGELKRDQFEKLMDWLLLRGLAARKSGENRSGVVMTDDGIAVMQALSPSPTAESVDNQPVRATQHSTAQHSTGCTDGTGVNDDGKRT